MAKPRTDVDWAVAMDAVGGDADLLREVVAAFVVEGRELLEKIKQAVASNNAQVLERAAHTLKGSLRYFGANQASDLARELEKMGREKDMTRAAGCSTQLNDCIIHVFEQLEEYKA